MDIVPDLSVCITGENRTAVLQSCLESLDKSADPLFLETIVPLQSTHPAIELLATRFPQIILYEHEPDLRPGPALNNALRIARGRYVLLLDQNSSLEPGCLRHLIDFLDTHPDAGVAGPRIYDMTGSIIRSGYDFYSFFSLFLINTRLVKSSASPSLTPAPHSAGESASPVEVDWITDHCCVMRREVIDEIGLPDPLLSGLYALMEYCRRARRAGWRVSLVPTATIINPKNSSLQPSWSSTLRYFFNG